MSAMSLLMATEKFKGPQPEAAAARQTRLNRERNGRENRSCLEMGLRQLPSTLDYEELILAWTMGSSCCWMICICIEKIGTNYAPPLEPERKKLQRTLPGWVSGPVRAIKEMQWTGSQKTSHSINKPNKQLNLQNCFTTWPHFGTDITSDATQ